MRHEAFAENDSSGASTLAALETVYLADLSRLKERRANRIRLAAITVLLDVALLIMSFFVASWSYLGSVDLDHTLRVLVLLIPVFLLISLNRNTYSAEIFLDPARSTWRAASGLVWATLLLFVVFFFLKISEEFSRVILGLGTVLTIGFFGVARIALASYAAQLLGKDSFARLCLYDGVPLPAENSGGAIRAVDLGLQPQPNNPVMQKLLGRLAQGVDGVVVHCTSERREPWAFMLKSLDVRTELVVPELSSLSPLGIAERRGKTSLVLGIGQLSWSQRTLKRCFDLCLTIALLPIVAPIMAIVAILIKLDSKGPVLFKQDRIGIANRKFKIFKFRTMRTDLTDEKARILTQRNDPRVTRIGNFLRKTSLDELPQLLNVLWGDMSIVGPRPHAEAAKAGKSLYWEVDMSYWHRHVVKPGITGLAQIRGHRGNTEQESDLQERLNADLEYVSNWSLANDFKIVLRTFSVIVHKNAF